MALTVPTAGSTAGRSAQIQIATPDTGNVLSQFGGAMHDMATQWQADQRQRQVAKTQLAITRELGQARQEVDQIGDPDQIGPAWDARAAAVREKYITKDLDPRVAEALDLSLTELTDRHALDLSGRRIALQGSARAASYIADRAEIVAGATNADSTTTEALIAQGEAAIADRVARNELDPAAAEQERQALRRDVYGNRANTAIGTDPETFLTEARAGKWNILGEDLPAKQAAAEQQLAKMQAEAAKNAEAAATAQAKAVDDRLKEMRSIYEDGGKPVDDELMNSDMAKASPEYAETYAARELKAETPGIKMMTPAQLDEEIGKLEGQPVVQKWQREKLKVMKDWRVEAATKLATDPVAWAKSAGFAVPEVPPFDPAQPEAFAKGLGDRLALDRFMREKDYTRAPAVLDNAEITALKPVLDPAGDPQARLALATSFARQGKDAAAYLATNVQADPVFTRATRILTTTQDVGLVSEMLKGQQAIALKSVVLPSPKDVGMTFDAATGGAFADQPALRAELLASASALYAANASGLNPDGVDSMVPFMSDSKAVDLFSTAVQRVTGGSADAGGKYNIGGVQEINGGKVLLPPGVAKAQVDDALENLKYQLKGQTFVPGYAGGGRWAPTNVVGDETLRGLKAASIDGKLPDLGADPARFMGTLKLSPVPDRNGQPTDIYEFVYDFNGRKAYVRTADNPMQTFKFRLPDLIRGTQK